MNDNILGVQPRLTGKIPSLDGLRAISILLVLIAHLNGTRNFGHFPLESALGDFGQLGVTVFFVISGFLITTLLIKEFEKTKTISLTLFYARRSVRIFPAAFAYLGCLALAEWLGWILLKPNDLIYAATYTMNHHIDRSWFVGHLWSLSVEEQFYLIWPAIFLWCGPHRGMNVALAISLIAPVIRLAAWKLLPPPWNSNPTFPLVMDGLAIGCLLAGRRTWLAQQQWYQRISTPGAMIAAFILVLLVNRSLGNWLSNSLGRLVINVLIAWIVDYSVTHYDGRFGRFLNSRVLVQIGLLSYSLYVWQQPFLNRTSTSSIAAFPLNIVLTVLVACLSYWLLEKPFMSIRHRLRGT